MRRRRLALLMAMVLGITSISPVSLTGMAAEETPLETEVVGNTEDTMSVEPQSAENTEEAVEIQSTETEAAVQETLVAETETIETETAQGTEVVEETQATEMLPQEPQTETETPEATEAPMETETAAVTETMDPETEASAEVPVETETQAETETEIKNEVSLQSEENYEVADLKVECSYPVYVLEWSSYLATGNFNFQITYTNGKETSVNWYDGNTDGHGNEIITKIYKADGTETDYGKNSYATEMGVGDYYFEFTCGSKTARQDFKIVSLEALKDSAKELKIGSNEITAGYDDLYLYHFKTDESKRITFRWDNKNGIWLFRRDESEDNLKLILQNNTYSPCGIQLDADTDYYLYLRPRVRENVSTELTIMDRPTITKIEQISSKDKFVVGFETNYTENLIVELSYENQPKEQIDFDKGRMDSYGNSILTKILNKEGEEEVFHDSSGLPTGDYILMVYNEETSLKIPIQVVTLKDKVTEELDLDSGTNVTLKKDQAKWLRFTAENDYIYTFDVKKDGQNLYMVYTDLYDESSNYIPRDTQLEKGKTYYLKIKSDNNINATIEVQKKRKPEAIEVIPGTIKYPANINIAHFTDWKFKFKFGDGTVSEEVKLNETTSDGYSVSPSVKKETENIWNYSAAEAGEYKVSFSCYGTYSEEYTFYQVSYTEYVDNVAIPLELNKGENVPAGQKVYLSYQVPENEDGYYTFLLEGSNLLGARVWDENGYPEGLRKTVYKLESSKKYLFELRNYSVKDGIGTLQKVSAWDMESPLTVKRQGVYLVTPPLTSKYRVRAVDQVTGNEISFRFNFIDPETKPSNFINGLTGGRTYIFILSSSNKNPCTITVEPIINVTSIDVSVDYSEMPEPVENIFRINNDGIKIIAHYSNGTSEAVPWWPDYGSRIDSRENYYYLQLFKNGEKVKNTKDLSAGTYTLEVHTWDDGRIAGSCEITVKSIKEVTEEYGSSLKLGEAAKLKRESSQPAAYYFFTPEETGRYEFEFSSLFDDLIIKDENGQKMTGGTISESGYQISLNQGITYYFAVIGGRDEKTVAVKKVVDIEQVDLQIDKTAPCISGIDWLEPKNIELKLTYNSGETTTIRGGEKDIYGNFFRLKVSGNGKDYNLCTGGGIALYTGDYTISASLRGTEENSTKVGLSVKELNLNEQMEVKAGTAFVVNGGREFFRFTPEVTGKYYVAQAPYGSSFSFKEKYRENWNQVYPSGMLEAGTSYLVQYEGNAGKVLIKLVSEVANISLESTEKPVEYLDLANKYMSDLALIVEYAEGRKEKVYKQDSYGIKYGRELRDSSGNFVANDALTFSMKLKAGSYSILLSGSGINLVYPLEVQSIKEQAQNLVIPSETKAVVRKGADQHVVFFTYEAKKSGCQELTISNEVKDLVAVDKNGTRLTLAKAEDGHYRFALRRGDTAYFAVDTDSPSATVCVKNIIDIVNASLKTSKIFYAGLDWLARSDLQLTANYTDNTTEILEQKDDKLPFEDSHGIRFRFDVQKLNQHNQILSGSSIYLKPGEYRVNAYLDASEDVLTSTTIQVQDFKINELPEIFEGKAFEVKGNGERELFQFTPKAGGVYELEDDSTGKISFMEYVRYYGRWKWSDVRRLKRGNTYLMIYQGSTDKKETLVMTTPDGAITTSIGGSLELDKIYDVSIGKAGDQVQFTFVPEKTGIYRLESKESDGIPYFELYKNLMRVRKHNYSLEYELIANTEYTVKTGIRYGNFGTYKITLSKQRETENRTPAKIAWNLASGEKTTLGVQGFNALEKVLGRLELNIQYAEVDEINHWSGLHFGKNKDDYGNTYEVSVTNETETALGREYQITVTCGELTDSVKVILLPEDSLELLNLNEERTVSFDGVEARQKYYRFNPEKTGYYSPTVSGKGTASFWQVEDMAGNEVRYRDGQNGYYLKTGETYYLRLSWYAEVSGSAAVIIQKSIPSEEESCSHNYIWVVDQDATCGTAGSRHQECSICHERGTTETIPATGDHTYQTIVDIAATCGSAGSQHEECTVCHTQKAATAIPATGQHQYVEVTDTVPTCGSTGTQHKECSICHTRENAETVAATGNHTFTTIVDRAATCGAAGSQHEECTVCHARKEAKAIPATGNHKFKTVVDRAATCGTAGSQHEECTVCHTKKAATAIPATGKHTYGAYETVKAATVFAAGSEERTCSVCGTKQSRTVRKLTAKISVAAKSTSVVVGSRVTAPKVTYANGDRIASWKTSNKAVATVDKYGRITGKKAGTAIITVTLKSKKSAKIKVTVKKKVTAVYVKLNRTSLTLKRGRTFQLRTTVTPRNTTDTVTYKTSNKNIVSVTSKGKLVAKKKGRATITVTVGRKKAYCRVVVK